MSSSKTSGQFPALRWRHAGVILTATFLLANWQLLAGRVYEKWDSYDLGTPYYSLFADFIRAGRLLYWNPWIAAGSPDFAAAGSGVFSPDMLLCAAITGPGAKGLHAYWLIVWLLGGLGMLLLARHLRAPVWGGLVVSLGFVFSGFYTGHAEHIGLLYSYSLLPFIIWRLDVALLERRMIAAAQAGACWGLSGLAGYAAFTVCTVALLIAWTAGRCFFAPKTEQAPWKQGLLILMMTGAVGIAVLLPSFVSAAYEGRGYSDRSGPLPRDFALASGLHPGALATFTSPAVVELKLAERRLWAYTDVSSISVYTGSITLLLALIALATGRQARWRWYLLGMAAFSLACAMSQALPLRGWIYDLVPPTQYFRHAAMLRGYFLFLISILALFGSAEIMRSRRLATRKLIVLAPLLAICATIVFLVVTSIASADYPQWPLTAAHFVLVWGGLLIIALALRRGVPKISKSLPGLLLILALVDGLATIHLSEGTLYQKGDRPPLPIPASSSIALGPSGFQRALGSGAASINLLFKIPTLRNYTPFKNRFHEAIAATPTLRTMALGEKRIWFAPDPPEVPLTEGSFVEFANQVMKVNAPVIVRHSRAVMLGEKPSLDKPAEPLPAASPAISVPATIIEYQPEKLVLDAVVPNDGWLMITDRWSRSWNVAVNGVAQPVWGANFIFRAVPVTQGNNRINFSFHPRGLPALLIVSWSTLAIIALLSLFAFWQARRTAAANR